MNSSRYGPNECLNAALRFNLILTDTNNAISLPPYITGVSVEAGLYCQESEKNPLFSPNIRLVITRVFMQKFLGHLGKISILLKDKTSNLQKQDFFQQSISKGADCD
ncbi:MAG: hypothetical protein JSC188_000464 [Candidatus Tokpelaia sp. JSC188]|nr:MAG: hypothetical protein JSC188_000464 [Candidatus Tokpelaia sp. JSC188]